MSKKQDTSVPKDQLVKLYRQALQANVPLDVIHQKIENFLVRGETTLQMEEHGDLLDEEAVKREVPLPARILTNVLPVVFIFLGLLLVGNVVWPIVSYYVFTAPSLRANTLLAPVPRSEVLDVMPQIIAQAQTVSRPAAPSPSDTTYVAPRIIKDELDYTNLSNWFTSTLPKENQEETAEYRLDIPKVEIEDARVKIGGSNLDKNLIQYPGTSLPGQSGEPVIFGHSVLRQFYNPQTKNPRRYFSIFSKIMTLEKGDKIYLTLDNIKYTYAVREKDVVQPDDTFILDQHYDTKQLKLVTCVPEGTYLERGVVVADLIKTE